jgi:ATP-dependent Lhr-like helicase
MLPPDLFHPAVADWFSRHFPEPTPAQAQAWPAIKAGEHTLIAAPTGSGKTLAAFLAAIDGLVRQGLEGTLTDQTQIVYVSPLKALSNDIQKNLEAPIAGIRAALKERGLPDVAINTWVRTGDTPSSERAKMAKKPPHIIVTTPESFYILLGSESGRKMLETTRWVIVDEIHAMAANKRGAHLALSLERLAALCGDNLLRIGLSATQKPVDAVMNLLSGTGGSSGAPKVRIVDTGHQRHRELVIEVPGQPLEAVMSAECWINVYDQLQTLIEAHRTTLVFVNTRRMAERVARALSERLGENAVTAHHGSMAKEHRLAAEQRLKSGQLRALVATASLELGIDIGDVDLVCQLGSPRSIASFLQRVGRSGHAVGATPRGHLFPLSRDELVECSALFDSVRRGELDRLEIPSKPLDVIAQQIVAECAAKDWTEDDLFDRYTRAFPYRDLTRAEFNEVLKMLAEGFTTRRGRRGALIHWDTINKIVRGRRGARLTALTSGGTIPDTADYQVLLEPENHVIGTVNEDFAIESLAGDVFQLGNASYQIIRVERGQVRVEDAHGLPPTIPFWLGEAPGRSDELSDSVSRLRKEIAQRLEARPDSVLPWLIEEVGIAEAAAEQEVEYLAAGKAALGAMPSKDTIVLERFFDEAGGQQLVIHTPYGSRINRAWGLALRKRFCRKFNFELQAAATEDNIVLSLTSAHSFDLAEVARYLHSSSVRQILVQALLDAPMFNVRWRWVAGVSLALPRFQGGKRVPPQFMRMQAEDLVAAVFPDQIACAENLVGEREIPDHPLTNQAIYDCLHEAMDIDGLESLLKRIEDGEVRIVAADLTQPSPLALEVLSARPYAFLDDAPLEERRTQAVMGRRWLDADSAADLGRLDGEAITRVKEEAWPEPANAEELHDALLWLSCVTNDEARARPDWLHWLSALAADKRVTRVETGNARLWIATERLNQFRLVWPEVPIVPAVTSGEAFAQTREEALVEIIRGRLEGLGPVTATSLAMPLGLEASDVEAALLALEVEGFVMRGRFTPGGNGEEWCDRRLLSRIHHYTLRRLRAEIEPVAAKDFLRFLFQWQRVAQDSRLEGPDSMVVAVAGLEGFEAPAGAWETEILPARIKAYEPSWFDDLCLSGRLSWARLMPAPGGKDKDGKDRDRAASPVRTTPIAIMERRSAPLWTALVGENKSTLEPSPRAQTVLDALKAQGASFFDELVAESGLLRPQVEDALGELVNLGRVNSDSFGGLRALLVPADKRKPLGGGRRRGHVLPFDMDNGGRWALMRRAAASADPKLREAAVEHMARTLLRRYGVVFWRLLGREAAFLPPWRELLKVYRRMEARGEIRGGRFVAGFSGEQYALPDAVGALREVRRKAPSGEWVSISGADPLNLVGILTPGNKLSALTGNRILFKDGVPMAMLAGGKVEYTASTEPAEQWEAKKKLLRSAAPRHFADLG